MKRLAPFIAAVALVSCGDESAKWDDELSPHHCATTAEDACGYGKTTDLATLTIEGDEAMLATKSGTFVNLSSVELGCDSTRSATKGTLSWRGGSIDVEDHCTTLEVPPASTVKWRPAGLDAGVSVNVPTPNQVSVTTNGETYLLALSSNWSPTRAQLIEKTAGSDEVRQRFDLEPNRGTLTVRRSLIDQVFDSTELELQLETTSTRVGRRADRDELVVVSVRRLETLPVSF